MGSHTPGPWVVSEVYEEDGHVLAPDGFPVAIAEDVAIMPGYNDKLGVDHWAGHEGTAYITRSVTEVAANARLIAAAPDLLTALAGFEWLGNNLHNIKADPERFLAFYEAALTGARNAIGKACGT